jgi:hypothetical protein
MEIGTIKKMIVIININIANITHILNTFTIEYNPTSAAVPQKLA